MSELQQEVVRMISGLSDDNIIFLIEIIHRLMPQDKKLNTTEVSSTKDDRRRQAFRRLDNARAEIKKYIPNAKDFEGSAVLAVSPEEFLENIYQETEK